MSDNTPARNASSAKTKSGKPDGVSAATSAQTMRSANRSEEVEPAVIARDITLFSEEGRVFGPLSFEIPGKGVTVLSGRGGSGRTALALCISGRMKLKAGELTVLGQTKLSDINKIVAIAGIDEIDSLDRSVKLRVVFSEHRAWSRPWIAWTKRADQEYYESLCKEVYGERDLPPLDAYISKLSSLDRILIRICLALHPANHKEIQMLVMDDLEQVHEYDERIILLDTLARIAERMPVVVNAVNPIPAHLAPDHTLIELFTDAYHIHPENLGLDPSELGDYTEESKK